MVLSDALLLAARVSCGSKQVVNNNNANNFDDHEIKKNGLARLAGVSTGVFTSLLLRQQSASLSQNEDIEPVPSNIFLFSSLFFSSGAQQPERHRGCRDQGPEEDFRGAWQEGEGEGGAGGQLGHLPRRDHRHPWS